MTENINKINLLRISGVLVLILNMGSMIANAEDSIVYVNTGGKHVYIDGEYRGDVNRGLFQTTLPAFSTHTLKVTRTGYNDFETTFKVKAGSMIIAAPMWPSSWGTPDPSATPAPTDTPYPSTTPEPLATSYPEVTPAPASRDKYLVINSEPSGANVYNGRTIIGTTPFIYEISDNQKIIFKFPGYRDKVTYIEPMTESPFKIYMAKSSI